MKKKNSEATRQTVTAEKELVVTEKPSVARDIMTALGGEKAFQDREGYFEGERYLISWAVGHLLEFLSPEEIDPAYKLGGDWQTCRSFRTRLLSSRRRDKRPA